MVHEQITKELCEQKHNNLTAKLNSMEDKLDRLLYTMNGNGHLGIAGKVSIMWSIGIFALITVVSTAIKVWVF